jgi:ribosomal protein S18 acetylase RimI-like enzyme
MLRPARPQDAAGLAEVQVRAWWAAYGDYVDHELLAEHTVAARTVRWRELLAGDASRTDVAEVAGRVAGFVSVGPVQHAAPERGLGELLALYVDPPAQGAGVGRALLAAGEERLRALGYDRAVLCVFARNERARAFYAGHGWRQEEPEVIVDDRWSPEVRYRRSL